MLNQVYRIIVVDDETDLFDLFKKIFREQIKRGEYIFVFANNGQEALDWINKGEVFHILFTDIKMPVMDGLTLLSHLKAMKLEMKTVVVSAYDDVLNIRTAMNRDAFDFLVKPIREEEPFRVIGELRELLKERKKIFEYTDTKGIHKISYDKILYFYSLGKRVHIVTSEKEFEYRGKLKDVADVTEEYFLLIHKSYLINMEHVEHYEYDNVVMKDKTRLSISKANRKKVRERLLQTEKKRL